MRKMATIRKIDAIEEIEGADAIETATIGGWKVVVKKGEHNVDDYIVYLEIDSWVPNELAPFLSKGEPREYMGIKGERLRTVRLKKQLSQGLVLPLSVLGDTQVVFFNESGRWAVGLIPDDSTQFSKFIFEGEDVSELLGVIKWEPPCEGGAQIQGQAKGTFPHFIRKTDQERCQNLKKDIQQHYDAGTQFEATLKLDGSSITVYYKDGDVGVCSRNQELKLNEENKDNTFVKTATTLGLVSALQAYGKNIAVQGELMGPGIQGNREGFTEHKIFVYDVFDIDTQQYLGYHDRKDVFNELMTYKDVNIEHVPILSVGVLPTASIDELLAIAEGPSINNKVREGVVYKAVDGSFSFKTISNKFLLKGGN